MQQAVAGAAVGEFSLSSASRGKLERVHPDLIAVVASAIEITDIDFSVIDGVRTERKQAELIKLGASWTMNSRHLPRVIQGYEELGAVGCAVDLAAWIDGVRWEAGLYQHIYRAMQSSALSLDIAIDWGGWWARQDLGHFELSWREYVPVSG